MVSFVTKFAKQIAGCFALLMLLVLGITPALAHTVAYGILASNTPGTYTFFYGSYHSGNYPVEGSLDLTCTGSPTVTKPFTTLYTSLPAGLHTGANANYFFASGYTGDPLAPGYSATAPHVSGSTTGAVLAWESVTFTGISNIGNCTYAFNPAPQGANISNNWNGTGLSPIGAIGGGTFPIQLGLTIAKTANVASFATASTTINYSYVVTNSGTVPLDQPVTVTDNKTTVTCPPLQPLPGTSPVLNGLAVGASMTCTASYNTTAADITALGVTNTASAKSGANFGGSTQAVNSSTTSLTVPVSAPTVAVKKVTVGGVGGPFSFTATNLSGVPPAITTTTAGTATPAAPTAIAAPVSAIGQPITITETPAPGFAVSSANCLDSNTAITANSTGPIGTLSGNTLTIPGSAVKIAAVFTCTFTNGKLPTVTVSKTSIGGTGAFTFTGTNGLTSQTITTTAVGSSVSGAAQTLTAASALTTITETPKPGFATTAINCTGLGTGGTATPNLAAGSVTLDAAATAPGSNITCSFTNAALPAITISKISNGGVGTFSFTGNNGYTSQSITTATAGTPVAAPSIVLTSAGVATTITETPATGFSVSAINCTGLGSGGTQTPNLAAGSVALDAAAVSTTSNIACTFTNTLAPLPTITITKISNGGTAAFNFTGTNGFAAQTITTTAAGTGVAGATQSLTAALTATTITESIPAAYQLMSVNCTGLGTGGTYTANLATGAVDFNAAATARGAAINCTFTNAKLPTLTLNKTSNGGTGTYNFTVTNADANVQTNAVDSAAAITTATAGTAATFDAGPTLTGVQAMRLVSITAPVVLTEAQTTGYNFAAATNCTDSAGTATITQSVLNNGTTGGTMTLTPPVGGFAPGATLTCNVINTLLQPNLSLSKSAPSPALVFGTNSTYTLTVTNNGNAAATTAQVIDQLPASLTFVSGGNANWTCANASGKVTCTFAGGSIATGGGTSSFPIVVTPVALASATSITNTASVDPTGGSAAPNPGAGCLPASACPSNTAAVAASIKPVTESGSGVAGTASVVLANIVSNDTVNGAVALIGGASPNAVISQSGTWPAGITLNTATGAVSITTAVQPGTYNLTYQLCDKNSPANCATVVDVVTISASIVPANDSGSAVAGTPGTLVANVAANDNVNGAPAVVAGAGANATVAQSGTWPTGLVLNTGTGAITSTAALVPGSYTVQYNLCDKNTPVNCALATVTVTVTAAITPVSENGTAVSGTASTPIANVVSNDSVNGAAATLGTSGNATVAQSGTWPTGITLNTTTGAISITAAVQPGSYSVTYQLCDKNSPVNCATVVDTITVTASIVPQGDSGTVLSGVASTPIANVAANDTVNGVAANPATGGNATISQSGTWPTGIALNTSTGAISTSAAVAPGTYTVQYQLCDKNSPVNCALQTVTITVNGNINPSPESGTAVSGTASTPIANVITNDTVNGAAASLGGTGNATIAQSGTWPTGIALNTTTGAITTTAAVQPGSYSVTYQLCDKIGPNCATTTDTITVTASIVAGTENGSAVAGTASTPIANVLTNDTVNGAAPTLGTSGNATIAQSGTWPTGISLNTGTGAITSTAAALPGVYSVTYQLCDRNSPVNCATVADTVTITASIVPVTESGSAVAGTPSTPIANVTSNDQVNSAAVTLGTGGNATIAQSGTWPTGVSLNTTTGAITTSAAAVPGVYSVTYQLCDKNSPVNCATVVDTVTVTASILPGADSGTVTAGAAATPVANVAANDTVNGVAANLSATGNATVAQSGTWPAGITLNTTTGAVTTTAALAPGTYTVQYNLCDKNTPVNCTLQSVTVTVNGNIAPQPNSGTSASGTAATVVSNVAANDQVNGAAATLGGTGNATIAQSGTWPTGIALNTTTGAVTTTAAVQPGTYTLQYQLCDKVGPNCATSTVTVTVTGNIIPASETGSAVAGTNATPITNVTSNDSVNGVAAALGTNATVAQSGTWPAGISLNTTTGAISSTSAALPGTYSLTYQLCDLSTPANCATVVDTVTISSSILPSTESGNATSGTPSTPIANVAANDTVNGFAATLGTGGNATVAQSGTWQSGITLDTATGAINVNGAVPPGSYPVTYQLCDRNTPANCATVTNTITVGASIVPANDSGTGVAGTPSTIVANVAANDTVNGSAALVGGVSPNATVATVGTWPTGVTLDPTTGAVKISAQAAPGAYTLSYRLCDLNTPANCNNATVSFTVSATILPVNDSGTGVSGTASTVISVITANDSVNGSGVALTGASANASVSEVGTWPAGFALNTGNGNITITTAVQPGVYTMTYQLCDRNTPANCATAVDTITVNANIAPGNDSGSVTSGTPATAVANVIANDSVNGFAATLGASGNATIAESGTAWPAGIALDTATGAVTTSAAVQPGSYAVTYRLCDRNPTPSCRNATITITVAAAILPTSEIGSTSSGTASTAIANVAANDSVNGFAATLGTGGNATVAEVGTWQAGISLNTTTGAITTTAAVQPGTYNVTYRLCDLNTPANCANVTDVVTVVGAIIPAADSANATSGTASTPIANVAANDSVNGVAATLGTSGNATVSQQGTWPTGITLDTSTGAVSTTANVQPGTYSVQYQLCDRNTPVNCALQTITITVAASIQPVADTAATTSGTATTAIANVASNDQVNGFAATLGTGGNAVLSQVSTANPGVTLNPATGAVSVTAAVQPGSYAVTYRLCDRNTPANCQNSTATVTVNAAIIPLTESGTAVSGTPATPIANVISNDSVNGFAATLGGTGNAVISESGSWPAGIALNTATGAVTTTAAVQPGTYNFSYQLCDKNTPANCATIADSITVSANIAPALDTGSASAGTPTTAIANVAINDQVNGFAATLGTNATIAQSGTWPAGITLDVNTGAVSTTAAVPPGNYTVAYTLCDKNTPANCVNQNVIVTVGAAVFPAPDNVTVPASGGTAVPNVTANDTVNGAPVVLGSGGNATISEQGTWPTGITLNTGTGAATVVAGTPPGTYTLTYQLCDTNTPVNCATSTMTIIVTPAIAPVTENGTAVSGTPTAAIANVASNDLVNGIAATLGSGGNATVAQSGTWPVGITLDTDAGAVNTTAAVQPGSYNVTYKLCDRNSPVNCATMLDVITVTSNIAPQNDSGSGVAGTPAAVVANVVANDNVNGFQATLGTGGNATIAQSGTWPAGVTLDPATGAINTVQSVQPGSYTVTYQLCDKNTPANCQTATASFSLAAEIIATPDNGNAVAGTPSTPIADIAANDRVNGTAAVVAGGSSTASVSTVGTWPAGITLNTGTGAVSTADTVVPGTYVLPYRLCDKNSPPNCANSTATVVVAAAILPVTESGSAVSGTPSTAISNVALNDTVNGAPALIIGGSANATVAQSGTWPTGVTLDPASGNVLVAATAQPGTYSLTYQLCDKNAPVNCATMVDTLTITANIQPSNDNGSATSGTASVAVVNVAANDRVNGFAAVLGVGGNATISQVSTTNPGVSLDPVTGEVNVAASVQPGSYTLTYSLCDRNSPVNCANSTVSITVAASILPSTDTGTATSGVAGTAVANVASNDTVNGAPAVLGSNATVAESGTWPTGITLDPATGAVKTDATVQPGSYPVTYQLCDKSTPANCNTSTVTIVVAASIIPANDTASATAGTAGTALATVVSNDRVNGNPVTLGTGGNASVVESGTWPVGISLDPATGAVLTAATVLPGTYTVQYQLCDKNTPVNCQLASVTVTVTAAIVPAADTGNATSGTPGTAVANVIANDAVNGAPATLGTSGNATIAESGAWPAGIALDPNTGAISTTAAVQPGSYTVAYQLCDRNSPVNCNTVNVTVNVAAAISPVADSGGATAAITPSVAIANVTANDTVNGFAATLGTGGNATISQVSTSDPAVTLDPATGAVTVAGNTAPGTYTVTYRLCDKNTPANCSNATATIDVFASIIPLADTGNTTAGAAGTAIANVAANDTINDFPIDLSASGNGTLSLVSSANPGITLNTSTGAVSVSAAVPPGTYALVYKLCDRLTPPNCNNATATVTVGASILPQTDTASVNAGTAGTAVANVAANDTVNGLPATLGASGNATVATVGTWPAGITLDPATGAISTSATLAPGSYTVTYRLCDKNTPANCNNATVTITVGAVIRPTADSGTAIAGTNSTPIANVAANDSVNGTPATLGTSGNATVAQSGAWPAGISLNPATGAVSTAASVPPGVYSVSYQLCDKNTPVNCATSTVSVTVGATIKPTADTGTGTSGTPGTAVANVAANDTVNGAPATLGTGGNATLSQVSTTNPGVNLDPATGAITVAAGVQPGTHTVTYQLCDRSTPPNCATSTVSVTIAASILPQPDTGSASAAGGTAIANVAANDKVNGNPATLGTNGNATVAQSGAWPSGITLDPATGAVKIAPGAEPGVYTLAYQLCDRSTPANCATQTIQVTVIDTITISGTAWLAGTGGTRTAFNPATDIPLPGYVATVVDYTDPANPVVLGASSVAADGTYVVSRIAAPANPTNANYRVIFLDPTSAQTLTPVAGTPNFVPSSVDLSKVPPMTTPANNNTLSSTPRANTRFLSLPASALVPGAKTPKIDLPLDPSGVVYDADTGAPVPNPTVEFCTANGSPLNESDVVGGASYTPVPGRSDCRQRTFLGNSGAYFIFFNTPGTYKIAFKGAGADYRPSGTPSGTSPAIVPQPTTLLGQLGNPLCLSGDPSGACLVQPQAGPPSDLSNTTATRYYTTVTVVSGGPDILNNHLPVDPVNQSNLVITKIADRTTAEVGAVIKYTINVKLASGGTQPNAKIEDQLPRGFTYIANTAAVSLNGSAPVLRSDAALGLKTSGGIMTFNIGRLRSGDLAQLTYRVRIGVGAQDGDGTNRANVLYGARRSATAQAKVRVTGGIFWREGCLVGRVYVDSDGDAIHDADELGVPNVRLYMEDGTFFITDSEGKYSFCGLKPITHVLAVDRSTLPKGSELGITTNRNAMDPTSQFVDIKFGELFRGDFAVKPLDRDGKDTIVPAVQERRSANDNGADIRGLTRPDAGTLATPHEAAGERP